jgi:hypothetical protein
MFSVSLGLSTRGDCLEARISPPILANHRKSPMVVGDVAYIKKWVTEKRGPMCKALVRGKLLFACSKVGHAALSRFTR